MKITILTDNPNSWIIPYVELLKSELPNHDINHIFNIEHINTGDVMLILGCEKIIKPHYLTYHKSNVVVHPSKLPKGKGFSPLAWQILEGEKDIPVTLFEAVEKVDTGDIYLVDYIKLEGHELNEEIKHKQGLITKKLIKNYLDNFNSIQGIPQQGSETFYPRRRLTESELDPNLTIKEQFNLLRVVDNERYPAYFYLNNQKYILTIDKQ